MPQGGAVGEGALELWGGIECTVNRVGDRYFNQLERNGHLHRVSDLERVAGLGIRRLRYPLLWELMEPRADEPIDWRWADERLPRLRELGIEPIVGLIHHGSGPPRTDLMRADFADGLARFAEQVATRFPWVEWYTPVNEPLTTARFSGLYGLWFPHRCEDRAFVRALLNQCRAIVDCMRAIRRINPHAKLLQTEDLGRTFSTPHMQYQADFDNERRWLGWDLLCGRVDAGHPLHRYLLDSGAAEAELEWFCEEPCPPDIVGLNHYVTSDRFLDECCELYPPHAAGSNGRDRYADVEAVRGVPGFDAGWDSVIAEAAERYGLPLALSEVHLGCTREEQLRWVADSWSAAQRARASGRDVRAVTAWALFGSFNWNSLLTRDTDHYEPGAFDIRTSVPRPTALAQLLRTIASTGCPSHPLLDARGWWRRRVGAEAPFTKPLLIVGSEGEWLQLLEEVCEMRGIAYRVDGSGSVEATLDEPAPWALVDIRGWVEDPRADPLWNAACGRGIPLLRLLAREFREEVVQPCEEPAPLIIMTSARNPAVLNDALDLLIDGESGRWHL